MTKKTITVFILLILFILSFARCTYKISGIITHKSGDTVKVKGYTFLVLGNSLKEGQSASFTQTSNYRKANSKLIKQRVIHQ